MAGKKLSPATLSKISWGLFGGKTRVVALCLLTYDFFLTASDEVDLVWAAPDPMRLSTILFALIRYCIFARPAFVVHLNYSLPHCNRWIQWTDVFELFSRAGISFVFTARTYAICDRNKFVLVALALLGASISVFDAIELSTDTCTTGAPRIWQVYKLSIQTAFDLCCTCLTVWRTFYVFSLRKFLDRRYAETSLAGFILNHGLFYFIVVTGLQIAEVGIYFTLPSPENGVILEALILPLSCIMTSRFLLHLRRMHGEAEKHGGALSQDGGPGAPARSAVSAVSTLAFRAAGSALLEDMGDAFYEVGDARGDAEAMIELPMRA